jgi:hypothetical protein
MQLFAPHRRRVGGALALSVSSLGALAACLMIAAPAAADGPCGQDYTGNSACSVNSAATPNYNGTIVAGDYYFFYAAANTHLTLSITDDQNPECDNSYSCGSVTAELYDAEADELGGSGWSAPENGITVPQSWSTIMPATGTYYVEVSGNLGQDSYGNPVDVPYTLAVQASPAVQWPAPAPRPAPAPTPAPTPPAPTPPACVVPGYGGVTLTTVEHRIAANHCTLGAVHYMWDRFVRRGRVVGLSHPPGTHLANATRVNIWISRGRRPTYR